MKDTDFIFKWIDNCKYITDNIKKELENENEYIWNKYNFRNEKGTQENIKCIPLFWINHFWMDMSLNKPVNIYRFIEFERYFSFVEFIKDRLQYKYPNTILYQVAFTNLPKQKDIYPHTDCISKCAYPYRIHVVIKSNSDVLFFIDNIAHRFKEGEIVEINNMKIHSVLNSSNEDRIHLLMDLIDLTHLPYGFQYKDINYKDIIENIDFFFGKNGQIRPNCRLPNIIL